MPGGSRGANGVRSLLRAAETQARAGYHLRGDSSRRCASPAAATPSPSRSRAGLYHGLGLTQLPHLGTDAAGADAQAVVRGDRTVVRSILFNATNATQHGDGRVEVHLARRRY